MSPPNEDAPQVDPFSPMSPALAALAPVVQQVAGGNPGTDEAARVAVSGQQARTINNLLAPSADFAAQVTAAFQAGKANSSNPQTIAGNAATMGEAAGAATQAAGQAAARINLNDATAAADKAKADADQVNQLGLNPNSPAMMENAANIKEAFADVTKRSADVSAMRHVGFFDDPANYLLNHIINIPSQEGKVQASLTKLSENQEALATATKALGDRTLIDSAINSKDTTARAADVYKQGLAAAAAAGIKPMVEAQQIQLSAYNLAVSQGNEGINAARLGIEQKLLPGQLEEQQNVIAQQKQTFEQNQALFPGQVQTQAGTIAQQKQNLAQSATLFPGVKTLQELEVVGKGLVNEYYGAQRVAVLQQTQARAAELAQITSDKQATDVQKADNLLSVKSMYTQFGMDGSTLTNLDNIPEERRKPLLQMATNLRVTGQIAATPAEARDLLLRGGIPLDRLPAGQQNTIQGVNNYYANAQASILTIPPGSGKIVPTGQALQDQIYANVYQRATQDQMDIKAGNNTYAMPSLGTLLASKDAQGELWANKNPLMKILAPLSLDGSGQPIRRDVDANMIINAAANLVNTNKASEAAAVAMIKDFSANTLDQIQVSGGYKRLAVPFNPGLFGMMYKTRGSSLPFNGLDSASLLKVLRIARSQALGTGVSIDPSAPMGTSKGEDTGVILPAGP